MRFYPKTQKYEFSNLPQNNRLKRRSTCVDHVSKVRFEVGGLDLCRFERKPQKLSSSLLSLSLFFFLLLLLSLRRAHGPFPFSSFLFKVRHQLTFIFFLGPSGPPFLHVGRTPAPHLFQMKGRTALHASYFYFLFLFLYFIFYILYFLCIFNNIKLTSINYLPRFCILITTKYLKCYISPSL
jgi:hypothetical protein